MIFENNMVKNERETVMTLGKATVFLKNEFFGNINKVEVKDLEIKKGKYAQYDEAYYLTFVPKGKRKRRGTVVYGRFAFVLVLEGQNKELTPMSMFGAAEEGNTPGVTIKKSRFTAFDDGFVTEFVAAYLGFKKMTGEEAAFSVGANEVIEKINAA